MGQFTSTSFEPVIKWSGSKRSQCGEIVSKFPETISTYYEPFIGGGSVLRCLMESGEHRVGKFIASDLNDGLINLWKSVRDCPRKVVSHYSDLWHQMNDGNHDKAFKRSFFNSIRERYNKEHSPLDFMFIMRTTTNGMPRYNSAGDFNNSFHITRDGIHPDSLGRIVTEWSRLLNRNQVEFICRTFADVCPQNGDFVYLDPPYANTKGMYFGGFDNIELFRWLDDANKYMIPVIAWEPPRILGLLGCVANTNPIEAGGPMFVEHSVVMILGDDPAYTRDIGILRASMAIAETYVRMAVDRIGQNAPEIMRYLDNRENPEHLPFFDDVRGIRCRLETLQ